MFISENYSFLLFLFTLGIFLQQSFLCVYDKIVGVKVDYIFMGRLFQLTKLELNVYVRL